MTQKYDVIIVGAACAGLTAGLYAGRRALKTLILSKDVGGQAAITSEIENYPGFLTVAGLELMMKFKAQAEKWGTSIRHAEVTGLIKGKGEFIVKSTDGDFETLSVILAFGLEHRKLGVPGEQELTGRGVTYCATCDGPLFKNKVVGVVGGGNSAFDAADYLADLCEKVYLFVRRDKFRAEQVLVEAVRKRKNVEIMTNVAIAKINGQNKLTSVTLQKTNQEIALDGLFIEIGYEPKTEFLKELVPLDERGQVIVDNEQKTKVAGLFAAGDITNVPFKQAVISAGEGAKAALSAARYIQNIKGLDDVPDWTRKKK